jgi:Raf kinase inhibitor-like YbhB/YbcL family protein
MRLASIALALVLAGAATPGAQAPAPARPGAPAPQAPGAPGAPAPSSNRPRAVQVMTLTGPWPDGGVIPAPFSQAGRDQSPALSWSNVPEGATSFVLIVHDLDAAIGNGTDDVLHWMVWNIPGSATSLPEGIPQGPQTPNGLRQISATGPNYRGPAAPSTGPAHHYVFELFALDANINIPAVGNPPAATRAAVMAAIATHVRGKGVMVGLYRRPAP